MSTMLREFGAGLTAFESPLDARLAFIRRTYLHVTGAALAFAALSVPLQTSGTGEAMARWISQSRGNWFIILGAFMLSGFVARSLARSQRSAGTQYFGLALEVVAWTLIFSPVLWIARTYGGPSTLPTAAGLTVLAFGGLSAYGVTSKKDFSFLRPFLLVASLVAIGLIVAAAIFGFELGIWFSAAMILLAVGRILFDTSRVLHDYRTDQHVAASLELFASIALLFWYVLRLLMQLQRR